MGAASSAPRRGRAAPSQAALVKRAALADDARVLEALQSRPELAAKPAASFREKGITLLHATAATGRVDVLAAALAALARADAARAPAAAPLLAPALDARAAGGATPLHLAAAGDHAAAVAALLSAGARADAVDARGRTPLHAAAAARAAAALAVLAPAAAPHVLDAPTADDNGVTALHLAANAGCHASVRALARAGADPCARSARRWPPAAPDCGPGATPMHVAAARHHVAACQAIVEAVVSAHGGGRGGASRRRPWEADPARDPRTAVDGAGNMPYHVAWTAGAPDLSGALNPSASVDTARERLARLPGAAGVQPLASLAAYAVRDGLIAGLAAVVEAEGGDEAATGALTHALSSSSIASTDCGVCFDPAPAPVTAPCGHALCAGCALALTRADARPPRCPFCRADVDTWRRDGARVWAVPTAGTGDAKACGGGCGCR